MLIQIVLKDITCKIEEEDPGSTVYIHVDKDGVLLYYN